ncbi:sensor histidine kinase [Streptomyces sulphureus]|uniref:sensor histidine kinase n=1 Tax=Streptomyces sulphureus TaxID=47758 RepID=UPI00035CBADD|nr:sensor histidine kinase [Streptomyces sulphureus]
MSPSPPLRSAAGPRPHPEAPSAGEGHDQAVARIELPQPRPPLTGATWREVAHLLSNPLPDTVAFLFTLVTLSIGAGLSVTLVGLPLIAVCLLCLRRFGALERGRVRRLLGVRIDEPSPVRAEAPGALPWLWAHLKDPVGWRHALYALIRFPWVWFTFASMLVSLLVLWPLLPWIARGLGNVDRALARTLLAPSDELERRVAELESDRGAVVDTAAADLRRIERDLHDGAQARLVSLAMELGLAKEKLLEDPHAAAHMVDEAHGEVKIALQELRDLARGIHPAILTDRGLGPALTTLTTRCTTPTTLTTDLTDRPAPAIEGIAYFTASELLQNITKHSHAHHAEIDLWRTEDRLMLQVWDNGVGGATAGPGSGGTGLAGLAERLDSVDGLLLIDSPAGGPTTITAELPWHT